MDKKVASICMAILLCCSLFFHPSAILFADANDNPVRISNEQLPDLPNSTQVTLSVSPIAQKTNNYCSAACGKMILNYFGFTNYTQSYLYYCFTNNGANTMASSQYIVSFFSSVIPSKHYYAYSNLSLTAFTNKIKTSIDNNRPVILSGKSFGYHTYPNGHFVVIRGYVVEDYPISSIIPGFETHNMTESPDNLSPSNIRFQIIDPYQPSGFHHWLSAANLYLAYTSNNGNIITGY